MLLERVHVESQDSIFELGVQLVYLWDLDCIHLQLKLVYTCTYVLFTFGYCTSEHVHHELVHLYLCTVYHFWILYLRTCTSGTCTLVLMYFLLLDIVPQNMYIRNLYMRMRFSSWETCTWRLVLPRNFLCMKKSVCDSLSLSRNLNSTDSFTVSHHQIRSWSLLAEDWRGREGYNKDWEGRKKIWKRKVPWRLCSWHTWHRGFSVQTLFMALLWQQPKIFRLQRMASHCLQLTELQMLLLEEI